ncbi:hypothetical protein VLK31_22035 [Variovorax sp. H27-G14]|uniref:hypothetical protein n=1 Tax=Variovorax sp. H27-G14 TaxID=3111914 RepID=UPI0038FCB3B0
MAWFSNTIHRERELIGNFPIKGKCMTKKYVTIFVGIFWAALANSAPTTPLQNFIADREFCAYMAALPENDSKIFLERYEIAMRGAIAFIRKNNQKMSEDQALFSIKAQCDAALNSMLHYK